MQRRAQDFETPDVHWGRGICDRLDVAEELEWLSTNGIGGYACGTVAGVLTRGYHGLLVAALSPPLGRTLLLAKLDETATYLGQPYALHANRWAGDVVNPQGFFHLDRFQLEGTLPVWTFACADALLQKRIWMQRGANTTYVQYRLARAGQPLTLSLKALVNCRDFHHRTPENAQTLATERVEGGLRWSTPACPLYLLCDQGRWDLTGVWHRNFFLKLEAQRGQNPIDHHLQAATLTLTLAPGQAVTVVASAEPGPCLDAEAALADRVSYEQRLLHNARPLLAAPAACGQAGAKSVEQLVLAADQFLVKRPLPAQRAGEEETGHSVIAGYPWFGDWGRDTMVSLAGLTLCTGRPDLAKSILQTYARFLDRGLLPNRFPDSGSAPEYNSADATLWFFEALRAYHAATGDTALVRQLYPALQEVVDWHERGTRYGIRKDPADGLLFAGEDGVQLTWMDAKVADWVVTPRTGKPVEVNALWFNALCAMDEFSRRLRRPSQRYRALAAQAQAGFARFWNESAGCCYDVLDGPQGHEDALRPNQLFAVSLPHSPLEPDRQRAVVERCAQQLLTPFGLRSLAPGAPGYAARYAGDQRQRDGAYHQGTAWSWLMGAFVQAHLRVYQDPALSASFLAPLLDHVGFYGIGSIGEVFDAQPPFQARGCIAQAWGVAEALRAYQAVATFKPMPKRSC